ncbi:WD repeat-containing protein 47-like isoform X2 [Brevipalpus obovatus]|uniref:WD repeat-containing protein 47-like isoform X2 n=1 Tax=Brevipalpus obovatus TaxID=246614 RepID=UPI003D9DEF19
MEFIRAYSPAALKRPIHVRYDDIIPQHSNFYFMGLYKSRSPSQSRSTSRASGSNHHQHQCRPSTNTSLVSFSDSCPIHSSCCYSYRNVTIHGPGSKSLSSSTNTLYSDKKSHFVPLCQLDDLQAIRAAEFHPRGRLYAIGSNSKSLRICEYPKSYELKGLSDHEPEAPVTILKKQNHHRGSIYCIGWNPSGDLIATGSNDKSVRMMRFDADKCDFIGPEVELSMHDGTVRDVCFMEDLTNGSNLLISAGAGDCRIYVTDCETATPFHSLSGHKGPILTMHTWGGAMFVTGSTDRTTRFWDLRSRDCVNMVAAPPTAGSVHGTSVTAVCVDPSGRLLVSGHEDSNVMLYDIRGNRMIQTIRPHLSEVRSIRFSPKAYYMLTGGYDNKVVLTDLQGDLTQPVPSIVVAEHKDKVIQARWHPTDFTFISTSADRSAVLWAMAS